MDMGTINSLIGSLGFPIAACIYMAWSNQKLQQQHKEEAESLRKVVEQNTLTVQKLVDKLDQLGDDRK